MIPYANIRHFQMKTMHLFVFWLKSSCVFLYFQVATVTSIGANGGDMPQDLSLQMGNFF